ncbi:hypothetical protein ACFQZE_12810 [Paenibacillus sp. GCM10027627]
MAGNEISALARRRELRDGATQPKMGTKLAWERSDGSMLLYKPLFG